MRDLYGLPVIYHPEAPAGGCLYVPPIRDTSWWPGPLPAVDQVWYDRIGPRAAATGAIVVRDCATMKRVLDDITVRWRYNALSQYPVV